MTGKEVRKLKDEEITIEVARLRRELFDLRSKGVSEKIVDTSAIGKLRRDIARLLTERNARRHAKQQA